MLCRRGRKTCALCPRAQHFDPESPPMPPMSRRAIFALAPFAFLGAASGCAAVTSAVTTLTSDPAVIALWGVAKGIGQVALTALEASNPAVALIASAISTADTLIAAGSQDATLITAQAHTVLLAAAPVVTVVANSAK